MKILGEEALARESRSRWRWCRSTAHGVIEGDSKGESSNARQRAKAVPATNAATSSGPSTPPGTAVGPLVVSETNPRYFTLAAGDAADGRAVYLTGSHVNNNFGDGSGPGADCAGTPEPNDFRAYLGFLKERGHNFIRPWRWEPARFLTMPTTRAGCASPRWRPWPTPSSAPCVPSSATCICSKLSATSNSSRGGGTRVIAAANFVEPPLAELPRTP